MSIQTIVNDYETSSKICILFILLHLHSKTSLLPTISISISLKQAYCLSIFVLISLLTFSRTHFIEWKLSFPSLWQRIQSPYWGRQGESRRKMAPFFFFLIWQPFFIPWGGENLPNTGVQTFISAPAYHSGCIIIPLPGHSRHLYFMTSYLQTGVSEKCLGLKLSVPSSCPWNSTQKDCWRGTHTFL